MKNQIILRENGIVFNPFEQFTFKSKSQKILKYANLGMWDLIKKLSEYKKSAKKLLERDQKERAILTFLVFQKIKVSDPDSKGNTNAEILAGKMAEPFNRGFLQFLKPTIPSRFQRNFYQLLILTGFNSGNRHLFNQLGYDREIRALEIV